MATINLNRTDVVSNRLNAEAIAKLNAELIRDENGHIDIGNLPTGLEVVGWGMTNTDGVSVITDEIDRGLAGGVDALLCRVGDCYVNLWINADNQADNGFDDQVELHFD